MVLCLRTWDGGKDGCRQVLLPGLCGAEKGGRTGARLYILFVVIMDLVIFLPLPYKILCVECIVRAVYRANSYKKSKKTDLRG